MKQGTKLKIIKKKTKQQTTVEHKKHEFFPQNKFDLRALSFHAA